MSHIFLSLIDHTKWLYRNQRERSKGEEEKKNKIKSRETHGTLFQSIDQQKCKEL